MAPSLLAFDIWVMLAVALACLPVFITGREIARWEGGVFLLYYVAYVAYLILAAQQHDALPPFSTAMLSFVVPLTVVTLVVGAASARPAQRRAAEPAAARAAAVRRRGAAGAGPTTGAAPRHGWRAAVTLAALAWCWRAAPAVFAGEVPRWSVAWLPALGLKFGFRMDGLAWLFALLISASARWSCSMPPTTCAADDPVPRFFAFLLLFMGAMLGVVLSDNLILLVVFWELTSLSSFLLIGYWHHRADARDGARMALIVTGAGGLCLLAGVLLLGHIVGSYDLDVVLASGDASSAPIRCTCRRWCWCCWARSPRARSSRSTSGCRMRWRRRRRCRPTCTRRPWSRPACSCWRGCGRRWPAREPWFWIVGADRPGDAAARRLSSRCSSTT